MNLGNLLLRTWISGITSGCVPLSYVCSGRGCLCPKPRFKPGGCGFPTVSPFPRALQSRMVEMQCLIPGGPFPHFCPIFLPFEGGGFNFPRGQWIRNVCSWAERKTSKTQDQGHRAPFLTPSIGSWHGSDEGWLLCKVTRGKIRGGFVFTNVLPKLSWISLKNINYRPRPQITGPIKNRTEIQVWRKKRGRMRRGWEHWCNPSPLLPNLSLSPLSFPSASPPAHHCQFFFMQWKENHWFVQEHLPQS